MTTQVFIYPTEERKERWEQIAEKRDVSMSEFIQNMVEARVERHIRCGTT